MDLKHIDGIGAFTSHWKKFDMLILKLHAFHNAYMYTGTYTNDIVMFKGTPSKQQMYAIKF